MGFTLLQNLGAAPIGALLTAEGARISARKIGMRAKSEKPQSYIKIELGASVAKAIGLFWAKRRERDGAFLLTINERSAASRFRLDFETFGVAKVEILALPQMTKKAIIPAPTAFV